MKDHLITALQKYAYKNKVRLQKNNNRKCGLFRTRCVRSN